MKYLIADDHYHFISDNQWMESWTEQYDELQAHRFNSEQDAQDYITETAAFLYPSTNFQIIEEIQDKDGTFSHRTV